MTNQNKFYLSSEQWMSVFIEHLRNFEEYKFFSNLYYNKRSFLNFFKDSKNEEIKDTISLYFSADNIKEHERLVSKYNNTTSVTEFDLITHENLVKKYCDVLSSINLYDISFEFMDMVDFSHSKHNPINNRIEKQKIYTKLFNYGLEIPKFFTPAAIEMTQKNYLFGQRNFLNLWFDGHIICNKQPDKGISLHLIKHIDQKNLSLDLMRDKFKYLNLLDKDKDTFNYLKELIGTHNKASFLTLVQKELKKYPTETYEEVANFFDNKKIIQTEINNYFFTRFYIDEPSLSLSGTLKAKDAENFIFYFLLSICDKVKSFMPEIESTKKTNSINFISKTIEDKEKINSFIETLNSSLPAIISQYNTEFPVRINQGIIKKSIDTILFSTNLENQLKNNKTPAKGNKL